MSFMVPYKLLEYLVLIREICHWYFNGNCVECVDGCGQNGQLKEGIGVPICNCQTEMRRNGNWIGEAASECCWALLTGVFRASGHEFLLHCPKLGFQELFDMLHVT